MLITAALVDYQKENGGFPDTGGSVQTACAYLDLDKLCVLRDNGLGSIRWSTLEVTPTNTGTGTNRTARASSSMPRLESGPAQRGLHR